jgi:hypothetical protein
MRSGVGEGQARGGRVMVIQSPSPADPSLSAGTNSSSSPPSSYKCNMHVNGAKSALHLVLQSCGSVVPWWRRVQSAWYADSGTMWLPHLRWMASRLARWPCPAGPSESSPSSC